MLWLDWDGERLAERREPPPPDARFVQVIKGAEGYRYRSGPAPQPDASWTDWKEVS